MSVIRHSRLLILGSGPAGYTAAVYSARANRSPLLITGLEQGGQLMTTTDVDNWPGDVEHLQGPALMERMRRHAERFSTEIVADTHQSRGVAAAPISPVRATTANTPATPSSSRPALRPSTSACPPRRPFAAGAYRPAPPATASSIGASAVAVVGGGNTAVEEALYLSNIASHVTLVHRRDQLRSEKILQDRLFALERAGKVDIVWNHAVEEILGDAVRGHRRPAAPGARDAPRAICTSTAYSSP